MGRIQQHLHGGHPLSVSTPHQPLRNHGAQILGHIHENLWVLLGWIHVDDPIQSLGRIISVQRGDGQMARTREIDGGLHGVRIPNLTDQNDIRRLAHTAA